MSISNNIVIISTVGNSGGGAIHDYLLCRNDFCSPFQGEEFRLIADPYGIENLFNNFTINFSINNSSEAFYQFEKYCLNISKIKSTKTNKLIYGSRFNEITSNYIKRIEDISYKGIPQFKSISLNILYKLFFKFKKKFFSYKNHQHNFYRIRLPKNENKFIYETNKYLSNLFKSNLKLNSKKNIILDQATNFWKPEIVFKYFNDAKIILVTRDPRSVYYSMKFRGSYAYPGYDIKIFVKWYKYVIQKRKKIIKKYKNNILEVKFEKFINNMEFELKRINQFLKIKDLNVNNFNYEFSKNNVFKAKYLLSKQELNFIEKNLKKFLQW